jgi:hypothetical protein
MMGEAGRGLGAGWARISAGAIALVAWLGIALFFQALSRGPASWPGVVWTLLGYFTIMTNLIVAIVFTAVAVRSAVLDRRWLLGGTTLSIVLVGVVYALLLHGLRELTGGSVLANILLHVVAPILVPLFWLAFVRKGALTWRAPFLWMLYPLGYFLYALLRGAVEGRYAYPFMDVLAIGWPQTLINGLLIAAGFVVAGAAMVWVDHWLAGRHGR